ncbi:MAG: sigma-70 family RNA polymerase sigma factor [Chitinophagales bacterium]|nr:sigma-70 family RNA polymerase sigma factor [Chitinophagales bacterium]MDW8417963.1 sigma-70 family RNA polymerase sigma factor [Chitinophagales bacterium]
MRTPHQNLTDQELVQLYREGNHAAMEILISRHKDKVFTSIYLLVRDKYLAEDLFQETFIRAIDYIRTGRYNDEGKFLPWVMRIGYNLCIDYFRKIKRSADVVTSSGDDVFKFLKFEDTSVEDHLEVERFENRIKELIEQLPEEQKEVVILRHFFNFSFKEVAEYTKAPLNTCLGRMRYALINLRKMMEKQRLAVR